MVVAWLAGCTDAKIEAIGSGGVGAGGGGMGGTISTGGSGGAGGEDAGADGAGSGGAGGMGDAGGASAEDGLAASFCQITVASCPRHPEVVGTFNDDWNGAGTSASACMQRA